MIGHEFTHGFDSMGRLFDGEGRLNNWWTEGDQNKFQELSQCMVKQVRVPFHVVKLC